MVLRRTWMLVVCIFWSIAGTAQVEEVLDEQLEQHHYAYNFLTLSRGYVANTPEDAIMDHERVIEDLGLLQGVTGMMNPDLCLLFYAYEKKDSTLWCWLIDARGIRTVGRSTLSESELAAIPDVLQSHLRSEHERVQRGLRVQARETTSALSERDVVNILFPNDINQRLLHYLTVLISPVSSMGAIPWNALRPFGPEDSIDHETRKHIDPLYDPSLSNASYAVDFWNIQVLESLGSLERLQHEGYYPAFDTIAWPAEGSIVSATDYSGCGLTPIPGAVEEAEYAAQRLGLTAKLNVLPEDLIQTRIVRVRPRRDIEEADNLPDWLRNEYEHVDSDTLRAFSGPLQYFATHSVSDPEDPLNQSLLYLSATEDSCVALSARQIQNIHKPNHALVVLSSCQSGQGKAMSAGMVGLARAFMLNGNIKPYYNYDGDELYGARNVVISLWDVDDASASVLMRSFVDELCHPNFVFPLIPLRKAILAYKATDPDPMHWAVFQCMGLCYQNDVLMHLKVD